MRLLKAVTIGMGILIVVGTALLGVLIARRIAVPGTHRTATLAEPAGTRIAGIAAAGSGLALSLQGGGPDRVIIIDPASLRITGTVLLH